MDSVRIRAYAKANLFLRVLAREISGFHSIETLFVLLDLHDDLTVERTDAGIDLIVEGADVGPTERNLAYRAAKKILDATNWTFGVRIRLVKNIPAQAGLGGGSTDGAAALHAVNQLADHSVPYDQLLAIGADLGSDVPFFVSRTACALGWGRGERLFAVSGPPAAPALVAVPDFGVSTREAYEHLSQKLENGTARGVKVLQSEELRSWNGIRTLSDNDFESVLFDREPRLYSLFSSLTATGPVVTRMCGSGSAMIAVYQNSQDRDAAIADVGCDEYNLIPTSTRDRGALPESEVTTSR